MLELSLDGVRGVLAALNARARYRYTGLYRLDPPLLRNLCLFDRENPTLHLAGDIDTLRDTYCAVPAAGRALAIGDALADARFAGHARCRAVRSYLGVPLRLADGTVWGTLCHFDARPRLAPEGELAVLEHAASLLAVRLVEARQPA